MFFDDSEKPLRMAALSKLMGMMDDEKDKKLSGLKKPSSVSIEIEGIPADEADEMLDELDPEDEAEDDSEEEPSDEEKAEIARKFHKYCYGGKV